MLGTSVVHVGGEEEDRPQNDVDSAEGENCEQIVGWVLNTVADFLVGGREGLVHQEGVGLNHKDQPFSQQVQNLLAGDQPRLLVDQFLFLLQLKQGLGPEGD